VALYRDTLAGILHDLGEPAEGTTAD